jgi:hypothetical protein
MLIHFDYRELGGIDMELFKIIAQKFRLRVNFRPETTWLDKLENGTIIGTVASVKIISCYFRIFNQVE